MKAGQVWAFKAFVTDTNPDAKRDDSLALISRLKELSDRGELAGQSEWSWRLEETSWWQRLLSERRACLSAPVGVAGMSGAVAPAIEVVRGAMLMAFLGAERQRSDHRETSEGALISALDRFRRNRGLESSAAMTEWLREQHISEDELREILQFDCALESAMQQAAVAVERLATLELKRRGEYAACLEAAKRKQSLADGFATRNLTVSDVGTTLGELMSWYQESFVSIGASLDSHAITLGFDSARDFLAELILEYGVKARPGGAAATSQHADRVDARV